MDDIRNLICKISVFKSIIGQNYSNVNSQVYLKGGKLIVSNSKVKKKLKKEGIKAVGRSKLR